MISPGALHASLHSRGVEFFAGVPDSLLKDFCAFVTDTVPDERHLICANEGAAVAAAAGHYLATGKPGLVYLQNSGIGNTVNPLLSLADPDVYGIPMVLLVGWRGEPGRKDEPQHRKQGRVMLPMLDALGIPHRVIDDATGDVDAVVGGLLKEMTTPGRPVALIVRSGSFERHVLRSARETNFELGREAALKIVLGALDPRDIVVGTTGMLSREIFEHRATLGEGHGRDFLTVGSMGHSSQIALGIALAKPDRQVWSLDGDGAVLMHMGSLAIIGARSPRNFKHVVFNNGAHDSVGGQPTAGFAIDFCAVARACRYASATLAETSSALHDAVASLRSTQGPALLEIRVNKGARKDLGRPTTTPAENRDEFMAFLR